MHRHFGHNHFQCWPHSPLQEVATVCRTVRFADHHVRVEFRFSVPLHDIAGKREHFNLFVDRNLLVGLLLRIEEPQSDLAKCADSGQMGISKTICIGELQQAFADLVPFVEHDRERLQTVFIVKQFRFHLFLLIRIKFMMLSSRHSEHNNGLVCRRLRPHPCLRRSEPSAPLESPGQVPAFRLFLRLPLLRHLRCAGFDG